MGEEVQEIADSRKEATQKGTVVVEVGGGQ